MWVGMMLRAAPADCPRPHRVAKRTTGVGEASLAATTRAMRSARRCQFPFRRTSPTTRERRENAKLVGEDVSAGEVRTLQPAVTPRDDQ